MAQTDTARNDLFGRFKVGTRIYAGSRVVLALLAGYRGLSSSQDELNAYTRVSNNSLRTEAIATNVANMRRQIVLFTENGH